MTQYDKQFTLPFVVQPDSLKNILAIVMVEHNLRNPCARETENDATYFFNGGIEKPLPGEDRVLSIAKVAT
jgi:2,3-bisphosphoglycerate-independent phosphoglycerate mutase